MSEPMTTQATTTTTTGTWAQQVREENQRERTHAARSASRRHFLEGMRAMVNIAPVAVLLVLAALVHGPVFGGISGYVAVFGGLLAGTSLAFIARKMRLGIFMSIVALFLTYIIFGGLFAIPETTYFRVVPTLRTLQMLVIGIVGTWKDLLTVRPPAGVFVGPTIMPYLSALVLSFIAMVIVLRGKRPLYALIPISILLVLGILWGSQNAPTSVGLGLVMGLVSLLWASYTVAQGRLNAAHGTVEFSGQNQGGNVSRWTTSAIMIAVALIAALATNIMVLSGQHRTVLRDYVEPPLDLREYHSPVSLFRYWNTTEKDTNLFAVEGLPEGGRVRLATLDYYDGTVFQILGDTPDSGFRHVGTSFTDTSLAEDQSTYSMSVTIGEYSGYWIPGVSHTRSLNFTSERAAELAENLYFADLYQTGLDTTKLRKDDAFTVVNIAERSWNDAELDGKAISQLPVGNDKNVPQAIAEMAAKLSADTNPGIEQIRTIQNKLHTEGFYSDGSDGLSLPGHRADRLNKFLSSDQLIGDDDQYAPAMALMLRSLGVPSRLVMGFYSENTPGGSVTFTGKDTHMWVEVPFDGVGWVAFDPTPPKDQTPQTETPKPKPNPRPQVLQPPEPPEEPSEVPPELLNEPDDDEDEVSPVWAWIIFGAKIIGGTLLLLSPLLLLIALKLRRRIRRRKRGPLDARAAGAWDEVIDQASDLGVSVTPAATRQEQARRIDADLDGIEAPTGAVFMRYNDERTPLAELAYTLDSAVFGETMPDDASCAAVWDSGKKAIKSIKKRLPWYKRLRAVFSTRSLRARRTPLGVRIDRMMRKLESGNVGLSYPPRAERNTKRLFQRRKNDG